MFSVKECTNLEEIKALFIEYSQIKGAEGCFVSFDKELADLNGYYSGGALFVGYEDDIPVGCIAFKREDDNVAQAKRLYVKPEYRGKGYSRILFNTALNKAKELGYKEVNLSTKPLIMPIGYGLYQRMGFETIKSEDDYVEMKIVL